MPIVKQIICPYCGKIAKESEVILKSDRMAQKLGFRGIEELIIHYRAEGLSYREIHETTGISRKTLDEHVPDFLRGVRVKTKQHKYACRNNGKKSVAARMIKWFDYPTANGKSKKQMSLEAMELTRQKLSRGIHEQKETEEIRHVLHTKKIDREG